MKSHIDFVQAPCLTHFVDISGDDSIIDWTMCNGTLQMWLKYVISVSLDNGFIHYNIQNQSCKI